MKFDFAIGNPPYQEESQGDSSGTNPVYHLFYEGAKSVANKVELITPARFLFNAGKTPKSWNEKMLFDKHFKVMMYEPNSNKVFPNIPLTGGVAVSYWDCEKSYKPIETFVPYEELRTIISRVTGQNTFKSIKDIIFVHSKFVLEKVYEINPNYKKIVGSNGKDRRVRANAMEVFNFFTDEKVKNTDIRVLGLLSNKRSYRYIDKELLEPNDWTWKYKLFVPESNGASGMLGEESARIISKPAIGFPGDGVTQTFIVIGSFVTKAEVDNLKKYILSKFTRVLLGSLKVTQRNNSVTWSNVPIQDFTENSDIDWSQSIANIDRQLYAKYGLADNEIAFIETHIKEMK